MAKPEPRRFSRKAATPFRRRRVASRWVRKNMVMDQRKLDTAREVLGAATETQAVDLALDLVVFRQELVGGIKALRKAGGIADVFEDR